MPFLNSLGGILNNLTGDLYLDRRNKPSKESENKQPRDIPGIGFPDEDENTRPCRGYYSHMLHKALNIFHGV